MSFNWRALRSRYLLTTALLLCATACSKAPPTKPSAANTERVAILPFENLTPDPALEWVGAALPVVLAAQTPDLHTFHAASIRDAQSARATRIIQGYITGSGVIRVYASVHDELARDTAATIEAAGAPYKVLEIANALAHQLTPKATAYTTTNPDAIQYLFSGQLDKAVAADPAWGLARLGQIEQLLRSGEREGARQLLDTAGRLRATSIERARMDVLMAELTGDRGAQVAALSHLAETSPVSGDLWMRVAEARLAAKDYRAAADAYGRALEVAPDNEIALNSRGYALAFAGDLEGARQSLEEYARIVPTAGNPLDSLGEVHFYHRRYADAERYFLEAYQKEPNAARGAEPMRAALSRFLAGDSAKADADVNRWFASGRGAYVETIRGTWMRLTGRPATFPRGAMLAQPAEALWLLYDGNREAAQKVLEDATTSADPNARSLISMVRLLAQPSGDGEVWQRRVEAFAPQPELAAVRRQLLGMALLLDRRYAEAAVVWREIYNLTPGLAANEARIGLAWALEGDGQREEAKRIMPYGFLPPQGLEPRPEVLLYRKAIELRAQSR